MFTISIDPGYRNLGIVIFDESIAFQPPIKVYSDNFAIGDDWITWYINIAHICDNKIMNVILPDENSEGMPIINIVCEKQKEHPYHELAGFIVGYLTNLFGSIREIKWVDPRAVWKSTHITAFDRQHKKQLTKEAIHIWNSNNDYLSDHEADCILNYYYYKGYLKLAKWRSYILPQLKAQTV